MAGTRYKPKPKAKAKSRPSNLAGGFLPRGATYRPGRADQGRDFSTDSGGPIIAPGNGVVVRVGSDPNGFGPNYPIVRFTSGPYRGQTLYIGHTHSALSAGQRFRAGDVLSYTGTNGVGNATTPGWAEIGFAPGGSPGPWGQRTPFGPGSAVSGSLQRNAPASAGTGTPSYSGPPNSPGMPAPALVTGQALPTDPGLPQPPMPQLPGSAYVSPHDPSEQWKMIAAQPLSSPESQRWAGNAP